jgi:hypothetical protein
MTRTVSAREAVPGGLATALPSPGTRLTLSRIAPSAQAAGTATRPVEVPTVLEDLRLDVAGRRPGAAEIVIARPAFTGDLLGETGHDSYLLRWVTDRGKFEVTGRYVSRERIGPVLIGWRLQVTGPVSRTQRRAHARVDVTVPVGIALPDGVPDDGPDPAPGAAWQGWTVNLSEGGVLATLCSPAPPVDAPVRVTFALEGSHFALTGRVVRHQPARTASGGCVPGSVGSDGVARVAIAVAFDTPEVHGDRLRPLLFAQQLRARRIGVL